MENLVQTRPPTDSKSAGWVKYQNNSESFDVAGVPQKSFTNVWDLSSYVIDPLYKISTEIHAEHDMNSGSFAGSRCEDAVYIDTFSS